MQSILHKKSQMEMFGLAVIIVLITIGFFLVVSSRINAPKNDYQKDYTDSELGQNFVNSLVSVTIKYEDCGNSRVTIGDLIKYCAKSEDIDDRCAGKKPCKLLNDTVSEILGNSLSRINKAYFLYTEGMHGDFFTPELGITDLNRPCSPDAQHGQRGLIPISLFPQPGNVFLYIDICK